MKNNYLYQGDYAELDEDIGWHDFALRNYDAQTGRWVQQDPYGQFASPYSGMGNDPVNLIDPSGGIGIPCPGTAPLSIFFMKAGEAIGKGLDVLGKISPWLSAGVDVARFGSGLYNNSVQYHMIDRQLQRNITTQAGGDPEDIINIDTKSKRAYIHQTNDDYDWVSTDGGKPEKRKKGETEKSLKENGYSIFHPKAVGNAVSDVASGFFLGAELFPIIKWFFKAKPTKNVPRPPKYPTDPTKPPADGWEWRGRPDSKPGSKDGNWYNPSTKESLRPDLDHPAGIDAHYDYKDPQGNWYRYFQDGRLIKKP